MLGVKIDKEFIESFIVVKLEYYDVLEFELESYIEDVIVF